MTEEEIKLELKRRGYVVGLLQHDAESTGAQGVYDHAGNLVFDFDGRHDAPTDILRNLFGLHMEHKEGTHYVPCRFVPAGSSA